MSEPTSPRRSRLLLLVAIVFVASFALFVLHARHRRFPPTQEALEQIILARNLSSGRGLVTDVVSSFIRRPAALTHPSSADSMPITAVVMAPFTATDDARVAIVPVAFLAAIGAVLAFLILEDMLQDPWLAFTGTALFVITPRVIDAASSTDSAVVHAAWVLGALLLFSRMAQPDARLGHAVGLGGLVASALLTRPESLIILPPTLILALVLARATHFPAPRGRLLWVALAAAAPPILAWSIRSFVLFGTPWNPVWLRLPGMANHFDGLLFAAGPGMSFWGRIMSDPGAALQQKAAAVVSELRAILSLTPSVLLPFVPLGLYSVLGRRTLSGLVFPLLCVPILLAHGLVLDVLAVTSGGRGWPNPMAPCLIALGLAGVALVVRVLLGRVTKEWAGKVEGVLGRGFAVLAGLALLGAIVLAARPVEADQTPEADRARVYETLARTLDELLPEGAAVMTNEPLELTFATERPSVMIPLDPGLEEVCRVSGKYRAEHLVLIDDPMLRERRASDFIGLFNFAIYPPSFYLLKDVKPAFKVWKIVCQGPRMTPHERPGT